MCFFAFQCFLLFLGQSNLFTRVCRLFVNQVYFHSMEKFEYQNTEFYFDFRFSIFAPLAFLCSNLYYSERAHCEDHVRSGGSHFHPSTKEKLGKN